MNLQKYDKYQIVSESEISVIEGEFIKIKKVCFELKDGSVFDREEIIKNSGNSRAVTVLALTKEQNVILIVQPRVHKENPISIELPAGYIDENETPEAAVKRELLEETGYQTKSLVKLFSYYQDQGCSRTKNYCFLALDCEKISDLDLDKDEYIEVLIKSYQQTLKMMNQEIINDAGSVITLEKAKKYVI